MENFVSWTELKGIISSRHLSLQYKEDDKKYKVCAIDGSEHFCTELWKNTSPSIIKGIDVAQNDIDKADFENNYKANANQPIQPRTDDGKSIVKAESRPLGTTTCFTCKGDSATDIGDGKEFSWDFSNEDDIVDSPEGFLKKRIEFKFLDPVWIKEGTVYFYDMPKGSYADVFIVCPTGGYYYDNAGVPKQATEDTIVAHYVMSYKMEGTVPMGDELNTETCSSEIPTYYKFWIDVIIPEESTPIARGHFQIELYRKRTMVI